MSLGVVLTAPSPSGAVMASVNPLLEGGAPFF